VAPLLQLSGSLWRPAWVVLRRHGEWFAFLYAVTVSALFVWVLPHTPATTALFMIAIGLPLIFRARDYIRIAGVVMVLIGVVGLIVLRAS
jgi:hypothetical protein